MMSTSMQLRLVYSFDKYVVLVLAQFCMYSRRPLVGNWLVHSDSDHSKFNNRFKSEIDHFKESNKRSIFRLIDL